MSGQHSEPIIDESTRTYLRSKLPEYLRAHGIDPERSFTCLNPNHSDFEQVMRYNPRTQTVDCPQCHASFDIFDLVSLEYSLPDTESAVHHLYQQYYGAAQPAQLPQPPQLPQPAPAAPRGRTLDLDLDNINSLSDDFFAGVKPVDHVPDQNFPDSTESDLDLSLPLERPQRVEPQFGPIMDVVIDARDPQPFGRPMKHAGANGGAPSGQPQGGSFPPFAPIKATKEPAHAEFELPGGSKKAPLGDVRVMGPLTGSAPVGAQGGASVGTSVGTVGGTVGLPLGLPLGAPQHTEPLPRMTGNAPRRADPFSDPEFLKAQKIKPTFVEPVPSQPHEPPHYVSPGSEEEERPSKLNPPNVRDLDHIQLSPEEIARRTAEIWGSPEPQAEATAAPEVPKAYTIPKDSPYVGAGVQAKALDPERRKAQENDARPEVEMPLRNPGAPSTLINGKAFDFDKKSVAEVQSGIRDVMRRNPPVPQREDNPAEVHTAISSSNPLREGPSTLIQRSSTPQAAPQGDNPYAKAFAALNATNDNATRISGYSSALHGNQHQPAPTVSTMISAEPVTPSATTPKTSIFSASTTGLDTNRHTSTLMSDNRGRILTDDFGHRVHEDELNQTKIAAARTATFDFLNPPKDEAKAAPDVILSATASAPAAASAAVAAATAAPAVASAASTDPVDQDIAALSQAATAIFSAITGIEPEGKANPAAPAVAPAPAPNGEAQPTITVPAPAPTGAAAPAPAAPEQPPVKKAKPEFFAAEEPETKILEVNPLEERPHDNTPELAPLAGDLDLPDIAKLDGVSPIDDDELGLLDSKLNPLARTVHKDPGFTLSEEEPETSGPQDAFSTLTATANALHPQGQGAPLSAPQPSAPAAAPAAPIPVTPAQVTHVAPLSPVPPVQAPQATPLTPVVPQVTASQTPRAAPAPMAQVAPQVAPSAPVAQPQVATVAANPVTATSAAAARELTAPAALPSQVRGTLSHYLQRCKDAVGACAYFTAQGLSPAIIERYCLGFDPAYRVEPNFNANAGFEPWQVPMWQAAIIPLNEDSYVAYDLNSPDLMHPDKRYVGQERCFNLNVLNDELTGPLVVCASELDALALLSLNVQTVALGATQHAGLLLEALLESDLSSCALYLCLPQEPGWNEVRDYLMRELSSRGVAVRALDLSYPYGSIIQAFSQDLPSLTSKLTQLNSIGDVTLQAAVTPQTLTPNHLVLNLETLARLELSPMMYAISSPAVALSRLVLASLIENKHNAILYAGSKMQWQMICSLLTFNQGQYGALPGALGLSMAGYQARFLELPLEQSAAMLEATLNHGLVAARLSGMAPTLMVDTFAFDHSMCAQLSPRLAQLASEFQVPVVVWCSCEQQSIFEGNALQTLAINQGNDNELIFTTLDSSCRLHSFSTKQG